MKILVVEDDLMLGDGVRKGLQQEGFSVDWTQTKTDATLAIQTHSYDVIVLDIALPDGNGLGILAHLRQQKTATPVLILTAYNATTDRVRGLNLGADDYMIKPFDIDELSARLRALHRRRHGITSPTVTVGDVELDPSAHSVFKDGQPVDLGAKEFAILLALFERTGRVVTKAELEEKLYGWGEEISSNAIEVLVHRIRKKLGNHVVKTIRGVGYISTPMVE